jgi:type II secretory pathway component PulF
MGEAGQNVFRSRHFLMGIVQGLLWLALWLALIKLTGAFELIFADFGVKLPAPTEQVLVLGNWLGHYWYLCPLPVFLCPWLNWTISRFVASRSKAEPLRRLWLFLVWLAPFVILALAVVCFLGPLTALNNFKGG